MIPSGSRRSKIRPPRKSLVSSSLDGSNSDPTVDFEKSWSILSSAITQIQSKNVSNLSYEQLYRKAYVLVLRKYGAKLYDNVASLITHHLLVRRDHLLAISDHEDFMKAVILEWDEHLQSMKFVSDVLMYLNRVYVKEHKKLLIYDLGIELFKDNVIKHNHDEVGRKIVDIVIQEITRNRKGEVITTTMYITKLINMLELLVESAGTDIQYGENYFQTMFEPTFLQNSETFFYNLSQEFVNYNLGSRYIREAGQFIKEEESRINFYLPSSTYPKLIDLMNNIIIKDKIDDIISLPYEQQGLSYWLQPVLGNIFDDRQSTHHLAELRILYELIGRFDSEYQLLRLRLKENIIAQGIQLPEFVKTSLQNAGEKKTATNSTAFATKWIDTVLRYREQIMKLSAEAFASNPIVEQTITYAMRDFINGSGTNRKNNISVNAPELLSVYMDYYIKQLGKPSPSKDISTSSSDSTDVFVNRSIQFLRYIKDKDAFEANYANHFAKRFLNSKGASQTINANNKLGVDLEELILSKLGEEMGTTSLDKIIKMNKDIKSSKDTTAEYKKHISKNQKQNLVDLELKICNVTDWPKSMTKDYKSFSKSDTGEVSFLWPKQLRNTIREFEEFWFSGKKNDNKSLYWSPKFGSIDMRITYPSRTYEINMSTYAGIIMLLFAPQSSNADGTMVSAFDEQKELTYDEIQELTGIPEADLKRHLQSIAVAPRSRLLIKKPMTKEVNNTDVFKLNENFKSPSIKVKVLTVSASSSAAPSKAKQKTEQEEEAEEVQSNIAEGRKLEVNAAIVRIMKSRHTVRHNKLIEELIKQLANRFQPSIILIKQRIEDLIEKEYLKRDDDDKNTYHYVA
ncbi:Cullin [Scheffersomyces xylosifermentans]|uniref:Cullin n=1 Tax=Scheffersomyces xylosifermentans TaxID=1304137 RepID=UPI00315DF023